MRTCVVGAMFYHIMRFYGRPCNFRNGLIKLSCKQTKKTNETNGGHIWGMVIYATSVRHVLPTNFKAIAACKLNVGMQKRPSDIMVSGQHWCQLHS